jgi:hypothetical protein
MALWQKLNFPQILWQAETFKHHWGGDELKLFSIMFAKGSQVPKCAPQDVLNST